MKEIIVVISLLMLLVGIIVSYNVNPNKLGTNLILFGIVGIMLVGLQNNNFENKEEK